MQTEPNDLEKRIMKQMNVAVTKNKDYWLVDRDYHEEFRGNLDVKRFNINGVAVGEARPLIIAGPCTVHSREQTLSIARSVKRLGADMFRGGAYKPRTSPYAFQGMEERGLKILDEVREVTGLPIVTEVMDPRLVEQVGAHADVLQIGARNMQNYPLLKEVGAYASKHNRGILLKTSLMPKLKEVLCAAEYLANEGAGMIIICERGRSVDDPVMRNPPNYELVQRLREATHLPIIGDPSHSTGNADLVSGVSKKYLASGANGLMVEIRRDDEPEVIDGVSVCDYKQSLPVSQFGELMSSIRRLSG